MSRDNGLPGYDNWLARELDLDGDRPEVAVFTESDVDKLVEEMRLKCKAIASEFAGRGHGVAMQIENRIDALRRPSPK